MIRDGDFAGFFGDDENKRIGFGGKADGGSVPGAVVAFSIVHPHGKDAAGGGYNAVSDDDASIMERGFGEEDGKKEVLDNGGLEDAPLELIGGERFPALDGDEGPDFLAGKNRSGFDENIDGCAGPGFGGIEGAPIDDASEKLAELGLEEDAENDGEALGNVREDGFEGPEVKGVNEDVDEGDGADACEDLNAASTLPDEGVDVVDGEG